MFSFTRALPQAVALFLIVITTTAGLHFEQRNHVSYLRGPYNLSLFYRHNETFRNGAAIQMMPRYSSTSPESANIFDNLHILHGIVYDILAFEGWTLEEKRAELYRVLDAMAYQPGDEKLARKFKEMHPGDDAPHDA